MPYAITKEFAFSASHRLAGLPEGHPCGRLHGHNYVVALVLESEGLQSPGFVRDYRDLDRFKAWLDAEIDHRDLNQFLAATLPHPPEPTAEHLARLVFEAWSPEFPELSAVRVSETPKTWAEYRPGRKCGGGGCCKTKEAPE